MGTNTRREMTILKRLIVAAMLLGLVACGSGRGSSDNGSQPVARKSASLVGTVVDVSARTAARFAAAEADGFCPDIQIESGGTPISVQTSPDCKLFVADIPPGDLNLVVSIEGIQGAISLADVAQGEVVEIEIRAGDGTLEMAVLRQAAPQQDILPEVVEDDGVAIQLPAGTFDQGLTVNGDEFTLTGAAPDQGGCEASEGWTVITGPVELNGDYAIVQNVKFLSVVTVSGDDAIFTNVCFGDRLVVVGGDSEVPDDGGDGEPAACEDEVIVDFESLEVDGAGAVHPQLNIETDGDAQAVVEGNGNPLGYAAPATDPIPNGCLGNPGGFADDGGSLFGTGFAIFSESAPNDISFSFAQGRTAQHFELRLLDFGDDLSGSCTEETNAIVLVELTAYDAAGNELDRDALTCGDLLELDLAVAGDACGAAEGSPGNRLFRVEGRNIDRVDLTFNESFNDPQIALDDVSFLLEQVVEVDVVSTINLQSQGVTPVHLFGDECFDVAHVDVDALWFGSDRATEAHDRVHGADFGEDGTDDLVLHFRTQEAGIEPNDDEVCLTGTTTGGRNFVGCDSIRIVPGRGDDDDDDDDDGDD
jgi:hypothetical protein